MYGCCCELYLDFLHNIIPHFSEKGEHHTLERDAFSYYLCNHYVEVKVESDLFSLCMSGLWKWLLVPYDALHSFSTCRTN
jgi:hypothetical protein